MFLQINNFFIIYTSWIFVVLLSFYVLFDESFQLLKKKVLPLFVRYFVKKKNDVTQKEVQHALAQMPAQVP